jgi:hypothetical protein
MRFKPRFVLAFPSIHTVPAAMACTFIDNSIQFKDDSKSRGHCFVAMYGRPATVCSTLVMLFIRFEVEEK